MPAEVLTRTDLLSLRCDKSAGADFRNMIFSVWPITDGGWMIPLMKNPDSAYR